MVEAKQKLEKTDTDLIEQFNEVKFFFVKKDYHQIITTVHSSFASQKDHRVRVGRKEGQPGKLDIPVHGHGDSGAQLGNFEREAQEG